MLIGTSILTTIDHLVQEKMFADGSEIRNIGFILSLLLNVFLNSGRNTRRAYEDSWVFFVIKRALQHGVKIRSNAKFHEIMSWQALNRQILIRMRENNDDDANKRRIFKAESSDEVSIKHKVNLLKAIEAYQPRPDHTTEFIPGVERSWDAWEWKQEFHAYVRLHSRNGKIGGTDYDLSDPEDRIAFAVSLYQSDRNALAAFIHGVQKGNERAPSIEVPD
ncbi:MAG: hypothetical protein Q9203_002762 [Teloschistes exilis]